MRDYSTYYPAYEDILIDNGEKILDMQLQGFDGEDVLIDGINQRVIVQDHTNPMNELKDERKIMCRNEVLINRGSLVHRFKNGTNFLVTSEVRQNPVHQTAKMTRCNDTLTYQNPTTLEIVTIPCIITTKSSITNDGLDIGTITLQDDMISVKVPFDEQIANFPIKKRFIFQHSVVYELTTLNRLTEKGLLNLTMIRTQGSKAEDKQDLNIADYIEPTIEPEPPMPTDIVISGSNTITLNQTNTYAVDSVDSILFYLKSDDGISDTVLAQLTEQSNNTCKIKANGVSSNVGKYFRLYASDSMNESYVRIMVKSLF